MLTWNITPPDKDNLVRTPGIDSGKVEWWDSRPQNLDYLKEGSIIVLKLMGEMVWSARGSTRYNATRFLVLRVLEVKATDNYPILYKCEEVVEFPLRREK